MRHIIVMLFMLLLIAAWWGYPRGGAEILARYFGSAGIGGILVCLSCVFRLVGKMMNGE